MNIYRMCGDAIHCFAILILLAKILSKRNCYGISGKMQILYCIVFTTRYLDIFQFLSLYNTIMKLMFIATSYVTVLLIYWKFRDTYDRKNDSIKVERLVILTMFLAILINYSGTVTEILWAFSIYLETLAAIPQLYMMWKLNENKYTMVWFLTMLGIYRLLYVFNWIYRYEMESHYELISFCSGLVQVAIIFMALSFIKYYKKKHISKEELIDDEKPNQVYQVNIITAQNAEELYKDKGLSYKKEEIIQVHGM